jgi:hypothetical protein
MFSTAWRNGLTHLFSALPFWDPTGVSEALYLCRHCPLDAFMGPEPHALLLNVMF